MKPVHWASLVVSAYALLVGHLLSNEWDPEGGPAGHSQSGRPPRQPGSNPGIYRVNGQGHAGLKAPFRRLEGQEPFDAPLPSNRSPSKTARGAPTVAEAPERLFRVPGEFESQQAVLLASGRLAVTAPETLAEIASALDGRVSLVTLVGSPEEEVFVRELLRNRRPRGGQLRTVTVPLDTQWVRDYGPIFVKEFAGGVAIVDAGYMKPGRPNDDEVPALLGLATGTLVFRAPVILDGGNLLSNGKGLFLATTSLIDENRTLDYDRKQVEAVLGEYLGCTRIEFLETLAGEPTRHVDMFAAFTDADTVVIGSYDSTIDPVNAGILDRNAACLAALERQNGPLRIVRLPMPPKRDGVWRTYTNVIFANGALLVPVYPGIDPEGERVALATFRRLLPDWEVVGIDASGIVQRGGALHCISMNVPAGHASRWSDSQPVGMAGAAR